jgi:hypothetical protein
MNILLDATLPPRFARALNLLVQPDHTAAHIRDILGNDATDRHVADHLETNPDIIVIGVDLEISSNPHRAYSLRTWQRPVFLLHAGWANSDLWDQAWKLTRRIPEFIKKSLVDKKPEIYTVPAGIAGRIRKVS